MVLRKNWLLALVALIVFIGLLVNYLHRVPQRHYCDFQVYYKAGQDFIKGKDIYFREKQEITPYKYSPFFAFVFSPLSLLPIKASAAVFYAINFISTILFFGLSFRLVRDSSVVRPFLDKKVLLIYILVILCSMRYFFLVWESGQVSVLMCALILLGLRSLSKGNEAGAGAFFAASILIKYTPVIFLPYLLFQRKFKAVLWSIFFVGLFLMLPALVVGISKEFSYLSSWLPSIMATSLDHSSYTDLKNQSIYSIFLRSFSATEYNIQVFSLSFNQALYYGRVAALLMYVLIFIPGRSKQAGGIIDFAMLMICVSLFNPNAWLLNFVSLLLAFMLLVQYLVSIKGKDVFVLSSLIAAFILTNIMSRDILGKGSENSGCIYSFTAWGALIIYAALLKLKFRQNNIVDISV